VQAEIIAIGSELLTPQRLDTNSLYLTDKLNALGVELAMKSVVGDDRDRLEGAIRDALQRSEILLLTGGLGPTEDDVTRDAVAQALGRPLVFREELLEAIRERFARIRRIMSEINRRQAYLVEGAEALPNPNGTAAGQWIRLDNGRVIALLPGPPRELKPMFESHVLPRLEPLLPPKVLRTLFWRVAGMPESDLDQLISPVYTKYTNPVTTILAAVGDIQIHLRCRCDTAEEGESRLAEVASQIEPLLGDRVYSRDGSPLEVVVGRMLQAREATLAVAESCTGGLLAQRITSVPGASGYFAGGFLVYTNRAKQELLDIPEELLERETAVSDAVARAMAVAARDRLNATYGVAITGYAGPDGGDEKNPVGTVFIGIATPAGSSARRIVFGGDRDRTRQLAAQTALDLLRRALSA
jgi:nicotinamide-nucleotide amidase